MPVFAKNVLLWGQAILPVNWCCCHSSSVYSCFIQKEQNGLNFQCKIACAPLFQTIPATTRACVPSVRQRFCAYTWRGLSLIHVPITSPPVCDDQWLMSLINRRRHWKEVMSSKDFIWNIFACKATKLFNFASQNDFHVPTTIFSAQ